MVLAGIMWKAVYPQRASLKSYFHLALLCALIIPCATGFANPGSLSQSFVRSSSRVPCSGVSSTSSSSTHLYSATSLSSEAGNRKISAFDLDYYNPNNIHPYTKPLPGSIAFFGRFVARLLRQRLRRQKLFRLLRSRDFSKKHRLRRALSNMNQ